MKKIAWAVKPSKDDLLRYIDNLWRTPLCACDVCHERKTAIRALIERYADNGPDDYQPVVPSDQDRKYIDSLRVMNCGVPASALGLPARDEDRPKVVCLCGSVRFSREMMIWAWEGGAKKGIIVLSWHVLPDGYFEGADDQNCIHGAEVDGVREQVDELHKRKIDLADEVWVVNVGGYIGESTKSEVAYAYRHGKPLVWLEPEHGEANLAAALALKEPR